jgi:hypothetical protein
MEWMARMDWMAIMDWMARMALMGRMDSMAPMALMGKMRFFPLILNSADISGIASLTGSPGQPLAINSQLQVNSSAQISQNLSITGTLTMINQILWDAETNIFGNGLSFRSVNPATNNNNGMRFLGSFIRFQSNNWIQLIAGFNYGVVINNNNLVCNGYYPDSPTTPNVGIINLYGERVIVNPSLTVNGAITNNSLTTNKFLKADANKIITSADITINDVENLSTRLTQNEAKIAGISLTSSGSPFTPPNQGASLIPASSANPAFKIKGLTSSNNILLMISTDSVDITIDPLLTTRIDNLEAKNYYPNPYSSRSLDINPWAVLYRTHGAPAVFDIRNGVNFVNVTNGQLAKGNKTIPAGGLVAGDLYKFSLIGAMTSDAKIDMTFNIFSGATRILTYTVSDDGLTNQGFEFSTTVHVSIPSANVALISGMGQFEKDGKNPSYATSSNINNLTISSSNTFDIYIKPVSTMINGSVSIYRYILETV